MTKPLTHNEMISAIFAANTEAVRLEGELKKVIKERDEARREVCVSLNGNMKQAHEYAAYRGWDCFKSDHIGEVTDMPSKETP